MSNKIIRYYDSNTDRFLKYGHGAGSKTIHRAVWAPGVENRQQAMNYVHMRIAAVLRSSVATERVVDIGCGVGGSMLYLAEHTTAHLSGVTISPRQAEVGRQLIAAAGFSERCTLVCGDFTDSALIESLWQPFDTAYAIESFLHMPAAELFFTQAARCLRPGAKLFVCDDFLASHPGPKEAAGRRRLLRRFKRGWQVQSLLTAADMRSLAEKHGFSLVHAEDLSSYLELNRPRDIGIRILLGLLGWLPIDSPFWDNLRGGDALQRLLLSGDIRYLLLRFEKITAEY